MEKRLTRKIENRLIGGVCSGLGQYLGIDPLWIRGLFVLWIVTGGSGVLFYFILWAVMPAEGDSAPMDLGVRIKQIGNEISEIFRQPDPQLITYAGVGLIGMGIIYLLRQFGFPWLNWVNRELLWAVVLVLAGVIILVRNLNQKK